MYEFVGEKHRVPACARMATITDSRLRHLRPSQMCLLLVGLRYVQDLDGGVTHIRSQHDRSLGLNSCGESACLHPEPAPSYRIARQTESCVARMY